VLYLYLNRFGAWVSRRPEPVPVQAE